MADARGQGHPGGEFEGDDRGDHREPAVAEHVHGERDEWGIGQGFAVLGDQGGQVGRQHGIDAAENDEAQHRQRAAIEHDLRSVGPHASAFRSGENRPVESSVAGASRAR